MRFGCKMGFVLFSLIGSFAVAQNKIGNGGNVVRCESSKAPVLLDFYERDVVVPSGSDRDPWVTAKTALQRLKVVAPSLAEGSLKRLETLASEIEFRDEIELTEIPDSQHFFKPLAKDCRVVQVAIRRNQAVSGEKRFLVRRDLWKEMAVGQQAGLLTHEILHEHFTKLGELDSTKARRVNAFLYANLVLNRTEFWKLIRELSLPIYP